MENTLENKAKFFAQYWGQSIRDYKLTYSWRRSESVQGSPNGYINLKPVSSITFEDRYNLSNSDFKTLDSTGFIFSYGEEYFTGNDVDYLRSKGYALPYMGLSVEKQIEYGWVKLSE